MLAGSISDFGVSQLYSDRLGLAHTFQLSAKGSAIYVCTKAAVKTALHQQQPSEC